MASLPPCNVSSCKGPTFDSNGSSASSGQPNNCNGCPSTVNNPPVLSGHSPVLSGHPPSSDICLQGPSCGLPQVLSSGPLQDPSGPFQVHSEPFQGQSRKQSETTFHVSPDVLHQQEDIDMYDDPTRTSRGSSSKRQRDSGGNASNSDPAKKTRGIDIPLPDSPPPGQDDDMDILPVDSQPAQPLPGATDDDGFQKVTTKRQRQQARRPRLHPAIMASKKPTQAPPPKGTVQTLLFRPVDEKTSLHRLTGRQITTAIQALPAEALLRRNIRHGGIALDFAIDADVSPILQQTSFAGIPVKIDFPRPQEGSQGTITGDFLDEEDLMFSYEAYAARRIGETRKWVLHFLSPELPSSVRISYRITDVEPYFRQPLQCFRCRRFDHVAELCRGPAHCNGCGAQSYESKDCPEHIHWCVNCGKEHKASFKQCTHRIFALRVEKIIATEQCTRQEARQIIASKTTTPATKAPKATVNVKQPKPRAPPARPAPAPAVPVNIDSDFLFPPLSPASTSQPATTPARPIPRARSTLPPAFPASSPEKAASNVPSFISKKAAEDPVEYAKALCLPRPTSKTPILDLLCFLTGFLRLNEHLLDTLLPAIEQCISTLTSLQHGSTPDSA